jgi:hypothetical protein
MSFTHFFSKFCLHRDLCYVISSCKTFLINRNMNNARIQETMKRVRLTIIALQKKYKYYVFWVCVCWPRYPTFNAHAPCNTIICGLPDCSIIFYIMP